MICRAVAPEELERTLFAGFVRRQEVNLCYRREHGRWVVRADPFIDDWSEDDYRFLLECLHNTLQTGGALFGVFDGGTLKGFASVESRPMGTRGQYRDLSSLHVSAECRRRGLGRVLLAKAAGWARAQGAEKLYISSHSALETQRFYRALGCTDALEPDAAHTAREPFDCQLEYRL